MQNSRGKVKFALMTSLTESFSLGLNIIEAASDLKHKELREVQKEVCSNITSQQSPQKSSRSFYLKQTKINMKGHYNFAKTSPQYRIFLCLCMNIGPTCIFFNLNNIVSLASSNMVFFEPHTCFSNVHRMFFSVSFPLNAAAPATKNRNLLHEIFLPFYF